MPVLEYVTSVKERLHQACQLAQTRLAESQAKMKSAFTSFTFNSLGSTVSPS